MFETKAQKMEKRQKEEKLELNCLLGNGYKAMKENREISIEEVKKRLSDKRRNVE